MTIRILQSLLLLMFRTLLSKSLYDASFLWPFLLRQPTIIDFKQIYRFQNIGILWYSKWNIRTYYSRIPKDNKNKVRNQKFKLHGEKYVQKTQKFVPFRRFFDFCEFELKELSCKGLLVNFEGTEEFVWFRYTFELQKFELHGFNCITKFWPTLHLLETFLISSADPICSYKLSFHSLKELNYS